MATHGGSETSGNWISRFLAVVFAIVAGLWLFEFYKTLPSYKEQLQVEKGVYQGPADQPLAPDNLEALKDRNSGQSF